MPKFPVELETHDAGSADSKVWYCGIRDFNNPLTAEDTNSEFTLALWSCFLIRVSKHMGFPCDEPHQIPGIV